MSEAMKYALVAFVCVSVVGCGGGSGDTPPAGDGGTDGGGRDGAPTDSRPPTDTGPDLCARDADCDDGVFCNGAEACDPEDAAADAMGCVPGGGDPCMASQTCDEDGDRCASECDLDPDADDDGRNSVECGGDDCDDADPNRYPGNSEVCDVADHDEDCNPLTFGVQDGDGDGEPSDQCCNVDTDGTRYCGTDCDDVRATISPTATEACDERDNDCDGEVDEGVLRSFTQDADGDGFGSNDPGAPTLTACVRPVGYSETSTDCDDTRASVNPGNAEICDAAMVDEDCDGEANPASLCTCTGTESRACALPGACAAGVEMCSGGAWGACSIAPATEICNEEDDDCDGATDESLTVRCFADEDNDGYADPSAGESQRCPVAGRTDVGGCPAFSTNRVPTGADIDCDDTLSTVRPDATETCDGRDNDCDGTVDEGVSVICYTDSDGDSYPQTGASGMSTCPVAGRDAVGGCPVGTTNRAPSGGNADCDDAKSAINPAATEVCDGPPVDEDCDGMANEAAVCACTNGNTRSCADDGAKGICAAGIETCAMGAWGSCSQLPATEVCNGSDDDCDGMTDETLLVSCYDDADDDTYPAPGATLERVCPAPGRGTVGGCPFGLTNRVPSESTDDCDDTRANVNPAGVETCDELALDEDCDGTPNPASMCSCIDGTTRNCPPPDSRCADGTQTCTAGAWAACTVSPIAEMCNYEDDDCDGVVDNGVRVTCYADFDDDGYPSPSAMPQQVCPDLGRIDVGGCPADMTDRAPGGANDDCNDANEDIHPGADEICDQAGVDQDCDGIPSPNPPCECLNGTTRSCGAGGALGSCASGTQSCVDGSWTTCSIGPMTDVCNGADDDCDGSTDEGVTVSCWADPDDDNYAASGAVQSQLCTCPEIGYTSVAPLTGGTGGTIDCREEDGTSYPGATELCDRVDNNCSSGGGVVTAEDVDNDGHTATGYTLCSGGFPANDCHDGNASVYGGQTTYFTSRYCPADHPCTSGCSTGYCGTKYSPPGGTMAPYCDGRCLNPVLGSWDYDCNGTADRRPSTSCTVIGDACYGGGVTYTGTPACGSLVTSFTCSTPSPGKCSTTTGRSVLLGCR